MGGEDAELFAVFGDGAAGDLDALGGEGLLDGGVGEGFMGVFLGDDFLDGLADAGVGDFGPFGGGVAGGEEAAHFGDAVGGAHVFAGHGAGDGGGVDADGVGDLVHGERFEVPGAEFEEGGLVADDLFGDGEDGALALVEGLHEGAAVAELVAEVGAELAVGAGAQHVLVVIVEAEAGEVFVGEDGGPLAALVAFDGHVGDDVGISGGVEGGAGGGVEVGDVFGGLGDLFDGAFQGSGDVREVFAGQFDQLGVDDAVFEGIGATGAFELEEEGLAEAGGGDAGRVEALEKEFGAFDDVVGDGEAGGEFVEGFVEEAAVVEVAEEGEDGLADVGFGEGEVELVKEVLLEGFGADDGVVEVLASFLVVGGGGEGAAFEDGEVAEVVVRIVDHFIGIGRVVFEVLDGEGFGVVLEDGVDLHGLLEELLEFQGVGLENFQALAHLGRQGLLLAQRVLEGSVRHGFCLVGAGGRWHKVGRTRRK